MKTSQRNPKLALKSVIAMTFAMLSSLALSSTPAFAQFGHHGSHHGSHHSRYSGSHLYLSPGGVGFGYSTRGFGIYIGPSPSYSSRYYSHASPYTVRRYYVEPPTSYRTYEPRVDPATPVAMIDSNSKAAIFQIQAEKEFRQHDYENAVRSANHAVVEDAGNGKLHLFISQSLFAVGDFRAAAAAARQAMSLLDRQDWGYLVNHYQKFYTNDDYVSHMDQLIEFIKKNPDNADAHFLRGYHYGFLGYKKSAREDLLKAVTLTPNDPIAAQLLAMMGGEAPKAPEPLPAPKPNPAAEAVPAQGQ